MSNHHPFNVLLKHVRIQAQAIGQPGVLPPGFTMTVGGEVLTAAGLAQSYVERSKPFVDLANAEAAFRTAEQAADAAIESAKAYFALIDAGYRAAFGLNSEKLPVLDIKQQAVRKPLSADARIVRRLKIVETRRLRGTLSPKQKRAIKAQSVPITNLVVDDSGVHSVTAPAASPESGSPSPAAQPTPEDSPSGSSAPAGKS